MFLSKLYKDVMRGGDPHVMLPLSGGAERRPPRMRREEGGDKARKVKTVRLEYTAKALGSSVFHFRGNCSISLFRC